MAKSLMWLRLPDDLTERPEVVEIGPSALVLHIAALCYSNRQLTDGRIPAAQIRRLTDFDDPHDTVMQLVGAGWWQVLDGGYQLVYLLDLQPTAAQVQDQRSRNAQRQRGWRNRQSLPGGRLNDPVSNADSNVVTHRSTLPVSNTDSSDVSPDAPDPAPAPAPDQPRQQTKSVDYDAAHAAIVAAPKKSRPGMRAVRHLLPENYQFEQRHFDYAREKGLSDAKTREEIQKFMGYHRLKGTMGVDWYAGWQNWVRNSVKFEAERQEKIRMVNGHGSGRRSLASDADVLNLDDFEDDDEEGGAGVATGR